MGPEFTKLKIISYSLVELLVTTSAFMILVSLFFPALQKMVLSSHGVKCAYHQGVLGSAMAMYTGDHQRYPPFRMTRSTSQDLTRFHTVFWDDLLGQGYDGRNLSQALADKNLLVSSETNGAQIYTCELDQDYYRDYSVPENYKWWNAAVHQGQPRSYSMNGYGSWFGSINSLKLGITGSVKGTQKKNNKGHYSIFLPWSQAPENIEDPSGSILLSESPGSGYVGGGGSAINFSPLNQFAEGYYANVKSVGISIDVTQNIPFHNQAWNYLMIDGHVENLMPEETLGEGGSLANPKGMWSTRLGH